MPLLGVYLVNPSFNAWIAASLMCCGVSKSGSPAPKPTTSSPSAFICLALASIAKVSDGERKGELTPDALWARLSFWEAESPGKKLQLPNAKLQGSTKLRAQNRPVHR